MRTSLCHPDRKHYSKGFCRSCYYKQRPHAPAECVHPSRLAYARGLCAECYRVARTYGDDALVLMRIAACQICGAPATDIDHDHATGVLRGRLCNSCNQGLGMFKDNPDRLRAAAAYLEF